MGDMGEVFRDMRSIKKEHKVKQLEKNKHFIDQNGLEYHLVNYGTTMLFREPGKPKVDYYPSTNKWKCGIKFYHGNVVDFVEWYEGQVA